MNRQDLLTACGICLSRGNASWRLRVLCAWWRSRDFENSCVWAFLLPRDSVACDSLPGHIEKVGRQWIKGSGYLGWGCGYRTISLGCQGPVRWVKMCSVAWWRQRSREACETFLEGVMAGVGVVMLHLGTAGKS